MIRPAPATDRLEATSPLNITELTPMARLWIAPSEVYTSVSGSTVSPPRNIAAPLSMSMLPVNVTLLMNCADAPA